jgi:hypothetical protein
MMPDVQMKHTSSVSITFGTAQAGNPALEEHACKYQGYPEPWVSFDKAITPQLNPRLCSKSGEALQ